MHATLRVICYVNALMHLFCTSQDFYSTTLDALIEAKNDRLWFKTQLKLCGLWFKLREFGRATKILRELHKYAFSCSLCVLHERPSPCDS
jgi:hypothetical protein